MPPKSNEKPLIKGQASLAGYFSGKGMTAAPSSAGSSSSAKKAKDSQSPAPKKASGSGSNSQAKPAEPVRQLSEKITVQGYKPSPSPTKPSAEASSAAASSSKKRPVIADSDSDDADMAPPPAKSAKAAGESSKYFASSSSKAASSSKAPAGKSATEAIDLDDSSDEELPDARVIKKKSPVKGEAKAAPAKPKRKAIASSDSESDEDARPPAKVAKSTATSSATKAKTPTSASKAKGKQIDMDLNADDDDDFEMGEVIEAPKPAKKEKKASPVKKPAASKKEPKQSKEEEKEAKKAQLAAWRTAADQRKAGPAAPGSKEIPQGKPDCLSGLTFVFTGELSSLNREEAVDLAKRYGAKVTTAPSSKTSYVVLGENAGPSKLNKIKSNGTETLDEDGFLNLIAVRAQGKPDAKALEARAKEEQKVKEAAKQLDKTLKQDTSRNEEDMLWTARYAPTDLKHLVGNTANINKMQDWLKSWDKSVASGFKKPGQYAINTNRALLLSGPPGVGKTSAAHLVAKLCGFNPIELNASDARSKKLIDSNLKTTINNTSLDGWYNSGKVDKTETADGVHITSRTCLIMDEVDGMSGGDRGGVGAINALIRKTKVPIICICNDAKSPKMKPFDSTCAKLLFQRPTVQQVRSRMLTIALREKLKLKAEVIDQLIQSANSDIRLVINMLSTWKLSQNTMDFDEAKRHGAANAKPGMHTPFSLYSDLSAPGMFAPTNKLTLNEKSEYYFNDHSIMPLMVQHNYAYQQPNIAKREGHPKEQELKHMQLLAQASASISDGDLIDSMIHGSQQHWSLMPAHAIASCVRPMSFMYGMGASGQYGPAFPAWLGQNSKQQRLSRLAVDLQARMRLTASGSRFEVREQYVPYLVGGLTKPLIKNGAGGVDEVVGLMDDYYLGLEDREGLIELGVGVNDGEALLKLIPGAVKSSLTREYNKRDHPIAFANQGATKVAKKLAGDAAPDTEDVQLDEAEVISSDDDDDDEKVDFKKDRMIKQGGKGKGKAKSKASPTKKK